MILIFLLLLGTYPVCNSKESSSKSSQKDEGNSHLLQASVEGILREVRTALKYGADINARDKSGRTPLMLAVINDRYDIVKDLVKKGADLQASTFDGDRTAFLWAVFMGNLKITQFLLSQEEIDVNEVNRRGDSALVIAAYMGQTDILQLLLAQGADINHQTTTKKFTALHFACFRNQRQTVELLLENNARLESLDSDGRTPLLLAALQGNLEMILFLLEKGANIEAQDHEGYSPLLLCVKMLHFACVDELIKIGSDVTVRTKSGENILSLAAKAENLAMVSAVSVHAIETLSDPIIQKKTLLYARKGKDPAVLEFLMQFLDLSL